MKIKTCIFGLTLITCLSIVTYASVSKPLLVIGSLSFEDERTGIMYPEIAVDSDGSWRLATQKDLWKGQKFELFHEFDTSVTGEVIVTSADNLPATFESVKNPVSSVTVFGVNRNQKNFVNKAMDNKRISPKILSNDVKNEFAKINSTNKKQSLSNVVRKDVKNILSDFPKNFTVNLIEFLEGDINGDGFDDYIVIVGGEKFRQPGGDGAGIVIYLKDKGEFKRISVDFWVETSDSSGWPRLLFTRDFNGDRAQELFVVESDGDTNIPFIYSWAGGSMIRIYRGEVELWNG